MKKNKCSIVVLRIPYLGKTSSHNLPVINQSENLFIPATGGLLPPTMPGHSAGIALPYNPDEARQMLLEAGYPGGRGFPRVEAEAPKTTDLILKDLRAQWQQTLEVDISWELLDADELYDYSSGREPHLAYDNWMAFYLDPDYFLRVGVNQLLPGWRNETYSGLVEGARRVSDQEARMKMYRAADKILIDEVALLPIAYPTMAVLVKPWVGNYADDPSSFLDWKGIVIEEH